MNKMMMCGLLALATLSGAFGQAETPAPSDPNLPKGLKLKKMTPEEMAARRKRMLARTGGFIENRAIMKGSMQYVNAQSLLPAADMKETVAVMGDVMMSDFRLVPFSGAVSPANAVKTRQDLKATAAVFLIADDGLPAFLVAPEEKWALVNVKALSKDNPAAADLKKRVIREMWRGLGYLFGAYSMTDKCLMRPIFSLNDLDNIGVDALSQEPYLKMKESLAVAGIKPYVRTSYRKACQAGWAPPPTNDLQKAVWDDVHKLPTDPLKIEFDPKKGK